MGGMISPPLMGSHGTMPLAVIAPLADIFRHMLVVFEICCEIVLTYAQGQSHCQGRERSHSDHLRMESFISTKTH